MGFVAELKRRNVIRMAGLYLVGAWLVVQVASTLLPMFAAPDWAPRAVVIALVALFLPVMVFSWVYELTPEGLKRESEIDRSASITQSTGQRIEHVMVVFGRSMREDPRWLPFLRRIGFAPEQLAVIKLDVPLPPAPTAGAAP